MGKFVLEWENICVNVIEKDDKLFSSKRQTKQILQKVSGSIYNYSLAAIMGASGAGKTTLLAALSGRLKDIQGNLYINNVEVTSKNMRSYSGYLYQESIFLESLTVIEHLTFMTAIKLNKQEISAKKRCFELLNDLSLIGCKNSLIKVLSGGERKRLALAVELINNPDIIFCDEPTTGLDSYNALAVIESLQSLANSGKLVIITIHQPSTQIVQYFTHLVLLSTGFIEYCGSTENGIMFLERFYGSSYSCVSYETNQHTIIDKSKKAYWPKDLSVNNSFLVEFIWLMYREYLNWKGNIYNGFVQFSLFMMTAALVSIIYQDVFDDNVEQNIAGLLYFLTTEVLFTHVYAVINTFPGEFCIFLREKDLYMTKSYFISKLVSMIPRTFLQPCFYFGTISFIVPFIPNATLYFQILFILFIASLASSLLGLCVSAHFTSLEYMDLFLVPFDTFSLIITGATLSIPNLPLCVYGLKYLSPFSFTYESLNILYWTTFDNTLNLNYTMGRINGTDILKKQKYALNGEYVVWNVFYLFLLSIGLGIFGFIGLVRKRNKQISY